MNSFTSRFRLCTRGAVARLGVLAILLVAAIVWAFFAMLRMPGQSHRGPLPELVPAEATLRDELRGHVDRLAHAIGPRCVDVPTGLREAADMLEQELSSYGYAVERQTFVVDGVACSNVIVERPGGRRATEIVVVRAHYDTCGDTPGADDNASGVAAVLALARRFADTDPARTLRFVCFVNEEPPYFRTADMGSRRYADRCRARKEDVRAMLSLEMLGCYDDTPGSQRYPIPGLGLLYPSTGDFIAFVGNVGSRGLVRDVISTFRSTTRFPSEGAALPGWLEGVGWSDHASFWRAGYPAIMVTDTAMFRFLHYHEVTDTPDRLDHDRMARVVAGLERVVADLAGVERRPNAGTP